MKPIRFLALAKKVDQFTYGLLYPAFFGNMVYDLIQAKTTEHFLKGLDFYSGLMILFFYMLDYVHLYVDVNQSVEKKVENKTWRYILCDIATSLLIFFSFVYLKNDCYLVALILTGIIPGVIAFYKYESKLSSSHKLIVTIFAIIIFICGIGSSLLLAKNVQCLALFVLTAVECIGYIVYIFFYYPTNKPL